METTWDQMLADEQRQHDAGACDTTECLHCEGQRERVEIAREYMVPFGKYTGKPLGSLRSSYWAWGAGQTSTTATFDRFKVEARILRDDHQRRNPQAPKEKKTSPKPQQKKPKTLRRAEKKRKRIVAQMERDKRFHSKHCD